MLFKQAKPLLGIYFAVNPSQYGEVEDRYLHLLAPTIYRHKKTALGYGLKFWPEDFETLTGALPHLAAFQAYK